MQKLKKEFPLSDDFLFVLKKLKFSARAQLFIVSLIALHCERERRRGAYVIPWEQEESKLDYVIQVRDKEISKKFRFSVDTIWRIREDFESIPTNLITAEQLRFFTKGVKYRYDARYVKSFDHEFKYTIRIRKKEIKIIKIPTAIIYDKDLPTKEKLSILWSISIKEKLGRLPRLKEIEKESGISEKTIRKAMAKYPQLFIRYE